MTRTPCCNKFGLRKGPWNSQEDEILLEYIKKNGEGNWSSVPKRAGLLRCGKSCRLRWANYLRPNLKRGAFTEEEETLILKLHKAMGNKWAKIAAELPGRTDNDIKNFWNTRMKRKLREMGIDPATHGPPTKTRVETTRSRDLPPNSGVGQASAEVPNSKPATSGTSSDDSEVDKSAPTGTPFQTSASTKLTRVPSKLMIDIPPAHLNFDPTLRLVSPNETQLSTGSSVTAGAQDQTKLETRSAVSVSEHGLDAVLARDDESVADSAAASSEEKSDVSFVDTWHNSGESVPVSEPWEGTYETHGLDLVEENGAEQIPLTEAQVSALPDEEFTYDFSHATNEVCDFSHTTDAFHAGDLFQATDSDPFFTLLDPPVDSETYGLEFNGFHQDVVANSPGSYTNSGKSVPSPIKLENVMGDFKFDVSMVPETEAKPLGCDLVDNQVGDWSSDDPSLNEETVLSAWSLPDEIRLDTELDSNAFSDSVLPRDFSWTELNPDVKSFGVHSLGSGSIQTQANVPGDSQIRSGFFSNAKLEENFAALKASLQFGDGSLRMPTPTAAYSKSILEDMRFPNFPSVFMNQFDSGLYLNVSPGF